MTKNHLGTIEIIEGDAYFQRIHAILEDLASTQTFPSVGLTGGSTPKAFYAWGSAHADLFSAHLRSQIHWAVSDERMVSLEHPDSNFGNADRQFLRSLKIGEDRKFPFPVGTDPHSAAVAFSRKWQERFGFDSGFDCCFLGMGDDGHTASLFPGSPILGLDSEEPFVCVDVPGKGWRLTITPTGLSHCGKIYVLVMGEGKAQRLKAVFEEPAGNYPIQILGDFAEQVTWLLDPAAAKELNLA